MHKALIMFVYLLCVGAGTLLSGQTKPAKAQDGTSAVPMLGPCQVFPANNPWNLDVSSLPVHPNSANYVANINSNGSGTYVHPDFGSNPAYGIPWITVTGTQPKVPVTFTWANESDPGPYPIPPNAPVEAGSDRHVLVVDTTNCLLYELFNATYAGGASQAWTADSGAIFDLKSNKLRPDGWTSADAAGLPILPGLARCEEVQAGQINHALRFTVRYTQRAYVYPARHYASARTDPNYPPMGLRMRLKASYNISGLTGQARVIAEALKKYGMILADNGSNWYISGETNPNCWDDADLDQLKDIPGTAFEAIAGYPDDTIGTYRPSNATFYLRNQNTTGVADLTLVFGSAGDLPVAGDWNADGVDTIGVYRTGTGRFFLRDSNAPNAPVVYSFVLGTSGDRPLAGDWDADGKDGVGVFRPSNGLLYLKNTLTTGFANYTMVLGSPGDLPVAGDWNVDEIDSPGVYRPSNSTFYLTNQVRNGVVYADHTARMGLPGDVPIAGDWNGDGRAGLGVFRPTNGRIYLKHDPRTTGVADITLVFGIANDQPVAGNWTAPGGTSTPAEGAPVFHSR